MFLIWFHRYDFQNPARLEVPAIRLGHMDGFCHSSPSKLIAGGSTAFSGAGSSLSTSIPCARSARMSSAVTPRLMFDVLSWDDRSAAVSSGAAAAGAGAGASGTSSSNGVPAVILTESACRRCRSPRRNRGLGTCMPSAASSKSGAAPCPKSQRLSPSRARANPLAPTPSPAPPSGGRSASLPPPWRRFRRGSPSTSASSTNLWIDGL